MTRITDVARYAGVSAATVSRVLNQPDLVAREKRDKVMAAVKALDYRPNALARSLRTGSYPTLALLVGDISQPFQGQFAKAIARAGEDKGFRLLLHDLDHSQERLIHFLENVQPQEIQGVLVATADELNLPEVCAALDKALERGVAVVCTSQIVDDSPIPAVVADQRAMGFEATIHLARRGVWPIVLVAAGPDWRFSRRLADGYAEACKKLGRPVEPGHILNGDFRIDESRRAIDTILSKTSGPVGVVAINVQSAMGVLQAASDEGRPVPENISVVCCEDVPLAAEIRPALTVVGISRDEVASRALEAIEEYEKARGTVTYVPHQLIARTSSGG